MTNASSHYEIVNDYQQSLIKRVADAATKHCANAMAEAAARDKAMQTARDYVYGLSMVYPNQAL